MSLLIHIMFIEFLFCNDILQGTEKTKFHKISQSKMREKVGTHSYNSEVLVVMPINALLRVGSKTLKNIERYIT